MLPQSIKRRKTPSRKSYPITGEYESELDRLQAELCHLQAWVKEKACA